MTIMKTVMTVNGDRHRWGNGQILCDTCEKSSPCRTLVRVDKSSACLAIVDLCCSAVAHDCAQTAAMRSTAARQHVATDVMGTSVCLM